MAKQHMKICQISLVTRKMQIKTTRFQYIPIRMANIEKINHNKSRGIKTLLHSW